MLMLTLLMRKLIIIRLILLCMLLILMLILMVRSWHMLPWLAHGTYMGHSLLHNDADFSAHNWSLMVLIYTSTLQNVIIVMSIAALVVYSMQWYFIYSMHVYINGSLWYTHNVVPTQKKFLRKLSSHNRY